MNDKNTSPCIHVSIGELVDKVTILRIKLSMAANQQSKMENIKKELDLLEEKMYSFNIESELISDLFDINSYLWELEDRIRLHEASSIFDEVFIDTARSIYKANDIRFKIKNTINQIYNSFISEEKILPEYKNEP